MMIDTILHAARETELPLTEASANLRQVLEIWRRETERRGAPPSGLDVTEVPRPLLPYLMLLNLDRDRERLVVRLAGTEVCAKYGGELKGKTTHDFFHPEDARIVYESALRVAESGEPSLARREYVNIDDRLWRYTRLILPLSRDGRQADSFFKTLDPATLNW